MLCFPPVRQPVGGSAVPDPKGWKGGMWKSILVVNMFRCSSVSNGFKMRYLTPHTFWCGVLTPDVPSASRCDYPGLFMFNPFGILPQKTLLFGIRAMFLLRIWVESGMIEPVPGVCGWRAGGKIIYTELVEVSIIFPHHPNSQNLNSSKKAEMLIITALSTH